MGLVYVFLESEWNATPPENLRLLRYPSSRMGHSFIRAGRHTDNYGIDVSEGLYFYIINPL